MLWSYRKRRVWFCNVPLAPPTPRHVALAVIPGVGGWHAHCGFVLHFQGNWLGRCHSGIPRWSSGGWCPRGISRSVNQPCCDSILASSTTLNSIAIKSSSLSRWLSLTRNISLIKILYSFRYSIFWKDPLVARLILANILIFIQQRHGCKPGWV